MRRDIIEASKTHVVETQNISRNLLEKAMLMRCVSYYADAKSTLLTQTIFEVEHSKKMVLRANKALAHSRESIAEKNRLLEQTIQQRTAELTRANRSLSLLNRCNQLQIRASSERELLNTICKLIASEKEYNLVWINTIDRDDPNRISCPAAYAGNGADKPGKTEITCHFRADQCLAMQTIQRGTTRIYRKTDGKLHTCPMRSDDQDSRALVYIPLKTNHAVFGSLNICSRQANGFHANEMLLLEDLTSNVSFGMHSFRLQEKHDLAHQKIKESLHEKEAMLREIHHRVRNNLQVVVSLLHLQARATGDPQFREMATDCEQRIMALASIHEDLYTSDDLGSIHCDSYFKRISAHLLRVYYQKNVAIQVHAGEIRLPISAAIPCGQIFHELVSNALKYAFSEGKAGCVRMSILRKETNIEFIIEDDGIGLPAAFDFNKSGKLGLEIVKLLAGQLDGSIELDQSGVTRWKITFPVPQTGG